MTVLIEQACDERRCGNAEGRQEEIKKERDPAGSVVVSTGFRPTMTETMRRSIVPPMTLAMLVTQNGPEVKKTSAIRLFDRLTAMVNTL